MNKNINNMYNDINKLTEKMNISSGNILDIYKSMERKKIAYNEAVNQYCDSLRDELVSNVEFRLVFIINSIKNEKFILSDQFISLIDEDVLKELIYNIEDGVSVIIHILKEIHTETNIPKIIYKLKIPKDRIKNDNEFESVISLLGRQYIDFGLSDKVINEFIKNNIINNNLIQDTSNIVENKVSITEDDIELSLENITEKTIVFDKVSNFANEYIFDCEKYSDIGTNAVKDSYNILSILIQSKKFNYQKLYDRMNSYKIDDLLIYHVIDLTYECLLRDYNNQIPSNNSIDNYYNTKLWSILILSDNHPNSHYKSYLMEKYLHIMNYVISRPISYQDYVEFNKSGLLNVLTSEQLSTLINNTGKVNYNKFKRMYKKQLKHNSGIQKYLKPY